MGKIVNLREYKMKQVERNNNLGYDNIDLPKIYITKSGKYKYDIIVSDSGAETLFNQTPIPKLSIAVYVASYCKDKLSEYLGELLSTDIIIFDEECSDEMNME